MVRAEKKNGFTSMCLVMHAVRSRALAIYSVFILTCFNSLGVTFSAALDRDTITVGETATLAFTCNGGQPASEPAIPPIPNLQIAYVGPSSQFSFINGQTTSSITYNFRVIPRQVGEYTIPAIMVDVGGQQLTSTPLLLKVTKPTPLPSGMTNAATQPALLKLILPKKEMYVGETFVAQLQLYLSSRVQNLENFQQPTFPADGFNIGKMQEGQRRQTRLGNSVFNVITLNYPMTAIKPGTYPFEVTVSLVLDIAANSRSRDPFFDSLFQNLEQRPATLVADPETVQVLPLPRENAPPNFSGAIGSYAMSVSAGPTNVTEGDPITLRVQISGRGSIENLTLPELSWPNFITHPPEIKTETSDQLGLQGTKTFEYIVTPQSPEVKALPEIGFSFFDPDAKAFRSLTHPAIALTVRSGGNAPTPAKFALTKKDEPPAPAQDIVPNKQRLGTVANLAPPLIQRPWFLAAQSVPVLALVASILWRRRTDNLANNPRLRRQRQVAAIMEQGFQDLRKLAAEKKSDEFFALVFRLLQEQVGERLDAPAPSITEAVIDERLKPKGAPESLTQQLHEIFGLCNQARYAPIKSTEEMSALIPRIEQALLQVRELTV